MSTKSSIKGNARCPYFQNVALAKGSKIIGVECEPFSDDLGFDVKFFHRMKSLQDLKDYTDIFCCDRWEGCPYAAAITKMKYGI